MELITQPEDNEYKYDGVFLPIDPTHQSAIETLLERLLNERRHKALKKAKLESSVRAKSAARALKEFEESQ